MWKCYVLAGSEATIISAGLPLLLCFSFVWLMSKCDALPTVDYNIYKINYLVNSND